MAIGMTPKKRGLFGNDFGVDVKGSPIAPPQTPPMTQSPGQGAGLAQQPAQGGGFFGRGGAGRAIAGTIGDALLQQSGMSPVYAPTMAAEQQAASALAAEQRKRSMDMADWQAKQDYQAANPAPTAMQQNLEYWQTLTPKQKQAYQEMKPEYRQGADGRFYRIDIGQQSGPQVGAVEEGYRFKGGNPSDPNAWEPVGGGVGNGTGNFL